MEGTLKNQIHETNGKDSLSNHLHTNLHGSQQKQTEDSKSISLRNSGNESFNKNALAPFIVKVPSHIHQNRHL